MKTFLINSLIIFYTSSFAQTTIYTSNEWTNLKTNQVVSNSIEITDSVKLVGNGEFFKVKIGNNVYIYRVTMANQISESKTEYLVTMNNKVYTLVFTHGFNIRLNTVTTSISVEDEWKVKSIDFKHTKHLNSQLQYQIELNDLMKKSK